MYLAGSLPLKNTVRLRSSYLEFTDILGIFTGLFGVGYALYTEYKRRTERLHRQQRFEWSHVTQGVRQICKWLKRDRFNPDFLIGVPGAGVILTELAVIELGEEIPIYMIYQKPAKDKVGFGFDHGYEFTTAKWRYWIPSELLAQKNLKGLIIDDYAQSGDSLRELKKALIDNGFQQKSIKTAALISVAGLWESQKNPDYSWFKAETHDVHMPWGHASKKIRTAEVKA